MEEEKMFCPNCGAENPDNSVFCANCGTTLNAQNSQMNANGQFSGDQTAPVETAPVKGFDPNGAFSQQPGPAPMAPSNYQQGYSNGPYNQYNQYNQYGQPYHKDDTLDTVIKVFMILSCIVGACACFIPLAWMIPMTVITFKKIERGELYDTGLKVCTLLFVGIIPGILMFVSDSEKLKY